MGGKDRFRRQGQAMQETRGGVFAPPGVSAAQARQRAQTEEERVKALADRLESRRGKWKACRMPDGSFLVGVLEDSVMNNFMFQHLVQVWADGVLEVLGRWEVRAEAVWAWGDAPAWALQRAVEALGTDPTRD